MPRFRFTAGERDIFRRLPPMKVSDWAAQHLIVPDGPYANNKWRREVAPYASGIMDAWGEPGVVEVAVCGAPQVGKTLVMYGCLGYAIHRRRGPRMLAMPDDGALAKMLEQKLKPLLRKSEPLRKLVRKFKASGAIGVHFRDGTTLHLASAQSPSQRASISIMDLFLDEEDMYKAVSKQGLPVVDFLERTNSYKHKRKIMRVCKPVGDEKSSIHRAWEDADERRVYEARCPACGAFQQLEEVGIVRTVQDADWQRIRREKLARYRCASCAYLWSDHMRDMAVRAGRWRALEPVPNPERIAFHLPGVLSRSVGLSEILAAKIQADATDDAKVKQAYKNGYWAEPYKAVVKQTPASQVLTLRDPALPARTVPRGFRALTCGIDMQKHHFWFTVYAWTPGMECVLVDYGRLRDFSDITALLDTSYPLEDRPGLSMPIWRVGLDTGGGRTDDDILTRTEEAYLYLRGLPQGRLFATKGASRAMPIPVTWNVLDRMPRSRAAIPGGIMLYSFDTGHFKSIVHARLQPDAAQPIRLHAETEQSYADQMTAERQVRDKNDHLVWERIRKDNHYLDCTGIAFACAHPSWTPSLQAVCAYEDSLREQAQQQPQASAQPKTSHNPYTGEEHRA